jgi:ATP:corrinoid adenosyltransferase
MRYLLLCSLAITFSVQLSAQDVEAAQKNWDAAKELIEDKKYMEAKPLLIAVFDEMKRPLTAYYLGLVYDLENKLDSAAYFYDYCVDKSRNPQLQAVMKLIRVKMRQLDIQGAYDYGLNAIKQNPDSKAIRHEFKMLCQWAYMLDRKEIDSSYLSSADLQENYTITTITQQEMILDNIRNQQDEGLFVKQRKYMGDWEIITCHWRSSKETMEIRFNRKERDLDKAIEEQHKAAKAALADSEKSLQVRIGAMLALSPIDDKTLENILEDKEWAMRLCACSEVKKTNSKRVKSICLKDSHEVVHAAIATMEDLIK